MKVGTDGVLLGAWAEVRPTDRRILDIGTATGLIALMMAQRAPEACITGIDLIDVAEARANADASAWSDRLHFEQCPVQEFAADEPFDLILSNPPFFVDSLTCPDVGRTTARHAVTLPYDDLCAAVSRLLAPDGRFALILPASETERWLATCRDRLRLVRRTDVRTTPRRAPKRVLLEFVRAVFLLRAGGCGASDDSEVFAGCGASAGSEEFAGSGASGGPTVPAPPPVCDELVIGTGEHECYTAEYRALTGDFYLKF